MTLVRGGFDATLTDARAISAAHDGSDRAVRNRDDHGRRAQEKRARSSYPTVLGGPPICAISRLWARTVRVRLPTNQVSDGFPRSSLIPLGSSRLALTLEHHSRGATLVRQGALSEAMLVPPLTPVRWCHVACEDSVAFRANALGLAARIVEPLCGWTPPDRRSGSTDTFVEYSSQLEDAILTQVGGSRTAYEEIVNGLSRSFISRYAGARQHAAT